MWFKVKEETQEFKRPYMEEPVQPSENGKFQVSKEVGEKLLEDDGIEVEVNETE